MLLNSKKRKAASDYLLKLSIASTCLLIAACSGNDNNNTSSTDADVLLSLVDTAGLTGDPTTGRTLPSIDDPIAQLGKKLFFTKGLGGNDDSACVTCHHPSLGGGDDLSLPIGVGAETPDLLGPGRFHDLQAVLSDGGEFDGGPTVPRNAPTTFNIAMWDQALFHDGRVESLGKTSGANGTITYITGNDYRLKDVNGTFNSGENAKLNNTTILITPPFVAIFILFLQCHGTPGATFLRTRREVPISQEQHRR